MKIINVREEFNKIFDYIVRNEGDIPHFARTLIISLINSEEDLEQIKLYIEYIVNPHKVTLDYIFHTVKLKTVVVPNPLLFLVLKSLSRGQQISQIILYCDSLSGSYNPRMSDDAKSEIIKRLLDPRYVDIFIYEIAPSIEWGDKSSKVIYNG